MTNLDRGASSDISHRLLRLWAVTLPVALLVTGMADEHQYAFAREVLAQHGHSACFGFPVTGWSNIYSRTAPGSGLPSIEEG